MRLLFLCLSLLFPFLPGGAEPRPGGSSPARDGDFTFKAEVIECLEGGPVVLRVTLTYNGQTPVVVRNSLKLWREFAVGLSTPSGWRRFEGNRIIQGPGLVGPQIFDPGEAYSVTVYAHEWFARIPSGRASLKVSCPVQIEGKGEEEVSTDLDVEVLPATPERLTAVRQRMEAALDRRRRTRFEGDPARWIFGTRQRAFVPVALRIIGENAYPLNQMLDFSYCLSDAPEEVHARMVALSCQPGWKGRMHLFDYWHTRCYDDPDAADEAQMRFAKVSFDELYSLTHRPTLPPQEFAKLLETQNPWTRILTYVTFPARSPREWKRTLLEDCRQLARPLPAKQLAPLLRELDDDAFEVRERASAALEDFGERVEAPLRQALQNPLSLEVKRRIHIALEQIAATPRPPARDVIEYLTYRSKSPEADAVLAALAEGDAAFSLTQAAKAAILQRQKNRTSGIWGPETADAAPQPQVKP
jgi:hypothetical protein